MTRNFVIALAAAVLLIAVPDRRLAAANNPAKEKAAIAAAESWLKLVDEEKYAASWQEAAAYFKSAVSKEQLETQLKAVRKPLGKKLSRSLQNSSYATSLPGAPDGEYVVIQFNTSFENKKTAVETVTPMLDKDGKWRVSGYYIK